MKVLLTTDGSESTRETALAMDRLAKKLESSSVNIEKHVFETLHALSCS